MHKQRLEKYSPATGVESVWDEHGIRLVLPDGKTKTLNALESAMWQLTVYRVPDALLLRFFASLRKTSEAEACRWVYALRNRWHRLHLLERRT